MLYFSSQSPPAARLSKRSSVDSGINMDSRTVSRAGKIIRDQQLKLSRYLSNHCETYPNIKNVPIFSLRFDRSMSLPVSNTSQNLTNSDAVDCFSLSIDSAMEGGISTYSNSTNLSNVSLLSPLRKMDFALCKQ